MRPQDKDIDRNQSVDVDDVDEVVGLVVESLATSFERSKDFGATFGHLMAAQLRRFVETHRSIRVLVRNREENFAGLSDAMSLAREQVEKVYVVALLLEDPDRWTRRYFKDDWRKEYERYLLERDECVGLAGHEDYLSEWEALLEGDRTPIGVSDLERAFVELAYRHIPAELRAKLGERPELKKAGQSIAHFPTPSGVIREVSDERLGGLLRRWYREYGFFSAYTHGGFRKLLPALMVEGRMGLPTSDKEKLVQKEYRQAVAYSWLATASACAVASAKELPRHGGGYRAVGAPESLAKLADMWDLMRRTSLPGKALWEAGARHFVMPTIGTA